MRKSTREAWIRALRSGKYVQGKHLLRQRMDEGQPDRFCCLGVLCHVSPAARINSTDCEGAVAYESSTGAGDMTDNTVPQGTLKEIGLNHNQESVLIEMNDRDDRSFDEIADYIESHIKVTA